MPQHKGDPRPQGDKRCIQARKEDLLTVLKRVLPLFVSELSKMGWAWVLGENDVHDFSDKIMNALAGIIGKV